MYTVIITDNTDKYNLIAECKNIVVWYCQNPKTSEHLCHLIELARELDNVTEIVIDM